MGGDDSARAVSPVGVRRGCPASHVSEGDGGAASSREITEGVGCSVDTANRNLDELEAEEPVERRKADNAFLWMPTGGRTMRCDTCSRQIDPETDRHAIVREHIVAPDLGTESAPGRVADYFERLYWSGSTPGR